MAEEKPTNEPSKGIEHVRREIDRVDNELLSLIAQRLDLAGEVRRAKSGARVWRPSREESHVRDLAERTDAAPAELVSRIWAELMSASLAIQGPMRLHVALEGDALDVWTLVRDRFGASIPALSYPTASSALAAAYADDEGVAVLPAPGGMNTWWAALCSGGAMPEMNILAGLPRTGDANWPRAVAVATADVQCSGADRTLIALTDKMAASALPKPKFCAEAGDKLLVSVEDYVTPCSDIFAAVQTKDPSAKIIGCLPFAMGAPR